MKILAIACAVALTLLWTAEAHAQPYPWDFRYDRSASLRLQVEPEETEVFIDGYWAGTVDDFDGFFQRLHLEPGEHEVELYLEGHRTLRQKIYLQPHGTFRIRHTMQPLQPGDTPDPRPATRAPAGRYDRSDRDFGTLAIRVQPSDAEILIDGERWDASADDRLVVQLASGIHRVEVRKEGFRTYSSEVRVRGGETTPLNVSLRQD